MIDSFLTVFCDTLPEANNGILIDSLLTVFCDTLPEANNFLDTLPAATARSLYNRMGTLAGRSKVIGVAPESTWIACKGCSADGCSTGALLECGQWTTCPTNPDGQNPNCAMAPLVSSNSWGTYDPDGFYDEVLQAYDAAGIHAVFAIGNGGPDCSSLGYPGKQYLLD